MNKTAEYNIREYEERDHDRIMSFILSIIESEFADLTDSFSLEDIDNIKLSYSGDRDKFMVVDLDSQIIGTLGIKEDDEKTALFRRIFIHPSFRRKGVGTRLVEKGIHFCKNFGFKTIQFKGPRVMSAAKSLLTKVGFREKMHIPIPGCDLDLLEYVINNNHKHV
ncbi:MAG: hypothetical protein A2096_08075 [Spirochaetes bacterium GWF1_41_5]|nr:MAG: hypothetical protein A2096_08075 [Spirochaetes bacterium GWF1_41_5]HBE01203.1 hypothetical protein [Spirochaetia bacterium]